MRTTSVKYIESAVNRTAKARMKRIVGNRKIGHERGARWQSWKSDAGFSDLGSVRREERASSEVSIAGLVGERLTARVWFYDVAARSEPNQSPEPTPPAVTISACAELAPAGVAAHL